jgi:hypothetical protein
MDPPVSSCGLFLGSARDLLGLYVCNVGKPCDPVLLSEVIELADHASPTNDAPLNLKDEACYVLLIE